MNDTLSGRKISITGIVQGVGFRPFVYTIAASHHISGRVWNTSEGVEIEAFGNDVDLEQFCRNLQSQPPILARIDQFFIQTIPYHKET